MIHALTTLLAVMAAFFVIMICLYIGGRVLFRAWWKTREEYYKQLLRRKYGNSHQKTDPP